MTRTTGLWIAPAVLALATVTQAHAQTRPDQIAELTLEELLNVRVVTVSRTSEGAGDAPGIVEVVTAAQIKRRGYKSLADLLRDLPGIKVDFAIDSDLSDDVTVHGTRGTSRIVVLLDGVRITSPTNEPLPLLANYPVHNARQVEFVYGPSSALYGADAFSGVINIISRDPAEADGLRAMTSIGQNGLTNTSASYASRLGPAHLMVGGQFLYDGQPDLSKSYPELFGGLSSHKTGTFDTIFGPMAAGQPISGEYELPLRAQNLHAILEAGRVRASFFSSMTKTSNTPAYTPDNAVYNDLAFAQNELLTASIAYSGRIGRADTTTTVAATRHELDPTSGFMNVFSGMQRSYKYAYGSMVRAEHQASWKASSRVRLTAGGAFERLFSIPQTADLQNPITDKDKPGILLGTTIPDEGFRIRYSNLGGYVQGQWTLDPRLTLTAGLRGDYNSRYETVFNPRLGLVFRPGKTTTAKLLYGTAYLAPSPYQAYSHYGAFYSVDGGTTYQSDFWHVPNPDLKPQYKRSLQGQLAQSIGQDANLALTAFYSRFDDLVLESDITSHASGQYLGWPVLFVQQSLNGGQEITYGATFSGDYLKVFAPQRQLRLRSALTLVDGHIREQAAPGGRLESGAIAPVLVQASADLDWHDWSVSPRLIAVGRQRALAFDAPESGEWRRKTIDGYMTVDLTVRRARIAGPLDLFVSAENLFDARYRHLNLRAFTNPEEFVGSPQNPRRLIVGAAIALSKR